MIWARRAVTVGAIVAVAALSLAGAALALAFAMA
jgi:hypothetical protein